MTNEQLTTLRDMVAHLRTDTQLAVRHRQADAIEAAIADVEAFAQMTALREDGWCVVIKCLPKELGWLLQGARSEYDAPCEDQFIDKGKWCCEAQDMRFDDGSRRRYRNDEMSLAETPHEAIAKVSEAIRKAAAEWEAGG